MQEIQISDIQVGNRFRKELGDIAGLAKSIATLGLLQPILVDEAMHLVCGQRRLEACKELGWKAIPARVVNLDALQAEYDENELRKNFTVTERTAIGQAIAAREKPKAKERQETTRAKKGEGSKLRRGDAPKNNGASKVDEPLSADSGRTDEKAAKAAGMGKDTYRKASEVVEAAKQNPELFGDLPKKMDDTGEVAPAHREMRSRQGQVGQKLRPKRKPKPYDVDRDVGKIRDFIEKLRVNWTLEEHKMAIRGVLRQLANEV